MTRAKVLWTGAMLRGRRHAGDLAPHTDGVVPCGSVLVVVNLTRAYIRIDIGRRSLCIGYDLSLRLARRHAYSSAALTELLLVRWTRGLS